MQFVGMKIEKSKDLNRPCIRCFFQYLRWCNKPLRNPAEYCSFIMFIGLVYGCYINPLFLTTILPYLSIYIMLETTGFA